jgi:hypothetical protein
MRKDDIALIFVAIATAVAVFLDIYLWRPL